MPHQGKKSRFVYSKRVLRILEKLDNEYGTEHKCFLNYKKDYELLFAVILSAQCTDARVNLVTEKLFKKYKTLKAFADADLSEIEKDIQSTGFFRNKAVSIKGSAEKLLKEYGGKVPMEMDELTSLPGVGRKTANVIRGELFKLPAMAVDTHVKRISKKLGLTDNTDPVKIEYDLMKAIPEDHWFLWNHDIITLGRTICIAGRERCGECFLANDCPSCKIVKKGVKYHM